MLPSRGQDMRERTNDDRASRPVSVESAAAHARRVRTGVSLALVLAVTATALAGCGGGSGTKTQNSGSTSRPSTGTPTGASPGASRSGIATVDDFVSGITPEHLRVTIYDLRRSGPFVLMDFGVVCMDSNMCSTNVAFYPHFCRFRPIANPCTANAGGISLVEPVGNHEYETVSDSQGRLDSSQLPDSMNASSRSCPTECSSRSRCCPLHSRSKRAIPAVGMLHASSCKTPSSSV